MNPGASHPTLRRPNPPGHAAASTAPLRLIHPLLALLVVLAIPTTPTSSAQPKGAEQLSRAVRPAPRPPATPAALAATNPSVAPLQIQVGPYAGWDRCFTLSNGRVEALVVPDIGRIQQFRWAGENSPFWEDPALHGHPPDPDSTEWRNFGGDKAWPAPQSDWPRLTPRAWPPPAAFDAMPVTLSVRRDTVIMTSPVDPHYGIRIQREIHLPSGAPSMTVRTTFEKVEGPPVTVSVWIVTQLRHPVAVFAPIPERSLFPEGYNRQSGEALPSDLAVERGLLSLTRDPRRSTKIGLDTDRLLWVGTDQALLIESPRLRGASYPDHDSSAEIYTNPDPKTYIELEMLGPLRRIGPGESLSQTNTYTLLRRPPGSDPEAFARKTFRIP
ncbi:MAG: DUF4380 domain-containing protein [Verrucomicrobiae bacterium]|nr:DUF4380 domain-containing protein [Verrucomicrobiae bacterium]